MRFKFTPNFGGRYSPVPHIAMSLAQEATAIVADHGKLYFEVLFATDEETLKVVDILSSDQKVMQKFKALEEYIEAKGFLRLAFDPWYGIGSVLLEPNSTANKVVEVESLCPDVENLFKRLFGDLASRGFGTYEINDTAQQNHDVAVNNLSAEAIEYLKRPSTSFF